MASERNMKSQVSELLSTLGRHPYGYLIEDFLGRFPRSSLLQETGIPYVVALGKKGCGKSSLLRALSGVPFPTGSDGTIVATEVILRRADLVQLTYTRMSTIFLTSEVGSRALPAINLALEGDFDLAKLVQNAEMQARDLRAWVPGEHILRIEVSGLGLPHVAFVDLPGKTGDPIKDAIVDKLIQRYVSNEGTVVLNAISGSDMSVSAGASGLTAGLPPNRTINVIVEPETVDLQISLDHLSSLFAERRTIHGSPSWHIVPSPIESSTDISSIVWTPPWNCLQRVDFGFESLRVKLLDQCEAQFLTSFSRVVKELEAKRKHYGGQGARCDESRPRAHLTDVAHRFETLLKASVNGEYGDFFFEIGDFNLRRLKIIIDETKLYLRSRLQRTAQEIRLLDANAPPSSISDFLAASQEGSELIQQFDLLLQQDHSQHSSGLEGKDLVEKSVSLLTKDWSLIIEECMYRVTQGCLFLMHEILHHTAAPQLSKILYKRVVIPASRSRETAALAKIRELAASQCLPETVTVTPELQQELEKLQKCLEGAPGPDHRDTIYSHLLCCSRISFELCLETIIDKIEKEVTEKCLLDGLPELLLHAMNHINISQGSLKKMLRNGCETLHRLSQQAECKVAYLMSKSDGTKNWPTEASRQAARRRLELGLRLRNPPAYMSDWCLERESKIMGL
ncbi:interferon-induced GTP-binding protein Mx [Paecilomyces variotii No. 5]|uniref:Interferon-induced GTP-binding protein Mx n=1 Tax=Byssochlamys spectabilis (strain No. 5 / NBRC 109023) TaxID=1356009 RepID=V5HVM6_BYSSN|nr:interferon-induced GTP-binding protein Mx [Paecilomyces variotii No. 5]